MWVEMSITFLKYIHPWSSSSWGCELKCSYGMYGVDNLGHPLREDVSWNTSIIKIIIMLEHVILFVRMWVEITLQFFNDNSNTASSSSWGCELKYNNCSLHFHLYGVILFVRMWVEILKAIYQIATEDSHPLREDVSWNVDNCSVFEILPVILFVRMWVEIDWLF